MVNILILLNSYWIIIEILLIRFVDSSGLFNALTNDWLDRVESFLKKSI